MSKNVKIIQNGNEKTLKKVRKIQTYLSNGRICNWVPEDEYPLGILTVTGDGVFNPADDPNGPYYGYSQVHASGVGSTDFGSLAVITITKNGEYIASDESSGPYYGYSKVIVNVEKSDDGGSPVVGKDDDGDDAIPKIDDDGHIVTEKLPTRISINVYPNNLVYEDGQLIDFTGLRVKAFLPDGTEWGVADDDELIKPVTVAIYDESTDTGGATFATISKSALHDPNSITQPVSVINSITEITTNPPQTITYAPYGDAYLLLLDNGTRTIPVAIATSTGAGYREKCENQIDPSRSYDVNRIVYTIGYTTRVNNTPFGMIYGGSSVKSNEGRVRNGAETHISAPWNSNEFDRDLATIIIDGDKTDSSSGSQQVIPIQWKRPGDGKVLETSFTIAVHGSSGGDNNSSGG